MDNSHRRRRSDGPPAMARAEPRDDWERAERKAAEWEGQREDWEWDAKVSAEPLHGTTRQQVIKHGRVEQ